jgi:hypothetical protein
MGTLITARYKVERCPLWRDRIPYRIPGPTHSPLHPQHPNEEGEPGSTFTAGHRVDVPDTPPFSTINGPATLCDVRFCEVRLAWTQPSCSSPVPARHSYAPGDVRHRRRSSLSRIPHSL